MENETSTNGESFVVLQYKNIGGIDLGMGVNKFEQLMSTSGMTIKPLRSRIVKTSDGKGKGTIQTWQMA
ncbi:MAG: hypothetical protein IPG00_09200 [Saprospiraceae bacterium]|nr:hypothetical protein [Saprospiraceae bacterium]MBK6498319.1 hypothetical protein [Saprospiraceae bacterium]